MTETNTNTKVDNKQTKEPETVQQANKSASVVNDANNQLAVDARQTVTSFMNPIVFQQMRIMATSMINSAALPSYIKNADQCMVVFQAGYEMGLKPFESVQDLYILNGGINFFGKSVGKQLRKHGWSIKQFVDVAPDDKQGGSCTATIENTKTGESYSETMTFKEAEQSGYTLDNNKKLKPNWSIGKNRTLKLRYNALDKIIRSYIPEVYGVAQGMVEVNEDSNFNKKNATDGEVLEPVDNEIETAINSTTSVQELIAVGKSLRENGKFTKAVQEVYNIKRDCFQMGVQE